MTNNIPKITANVNRYLISECRKELNKIGEITFDNVSKTDDSTRKFLCENSPARLKELAQMNCYAAEKIKKYMDNEYGKNNYVLIAIGRSISSIAELMKAMGADTKNIPMSGLRQVEVNNIKLSDLYIYKKFLAQIGLSNTILKNNKDKTYVLMDYTYYGRSLEKMEKLLKRKDMLGDVNNLISIPISEVLGKDYEKMGYYHLFQFCRFKDYSYVGRLHVNELKDVYKKCSPENNKEFNGNITKWLRKLFWFNVFNFIKEGNYKNIIPRNELKSIYKHHLSPKAINNYLKREIAKISEETDK